MQSNALLNLRRNNLRRIHPIIALFALALVLIPAPAARSAPRLEQDPASPTPTVGTLFVHRFTESVALTRDGTRQETTGKPAANIRFILEPVEFDEPAATNSGVPDANRPVAQASGQTGYPTLQIQSLKVIGPARYIKTDADGIAIFSELPLGTYRVREDGDDSIKSQPFLIAIPMPHPTNTGEWLYEVHAYPKLADSSVPVTTAHRLATTGPAAVLIIGALGCLCAANISILRLRKKEH